MRPTVQFLSPELKQKIVSEARNLLCELGLTIHNTPILEMLSGHGAKVDMNTFKVNLTEEIIDKALETVASSFRLYDIHGQLTHDFSDSTVYFTPGSSAITFLDPVTENIRKPLTRDYINYVKTVSQLDHIASQSTAMVCSDVHEKISDSYRLYLNLMYGEKPVITGAFSVEGLLFMKDLLLTIRGTEKNLAEKPLAVFTCCPTSPLKWSEVTSQNVVDCARHSIPVEFVCMPMAGFISPVTLVGTLIQHTAENLSGIVISQLTNPGAPALYGGSPTVFDIRYETTPMGAIETQMIDCACNEIGKYLGLPTQAYIGLTDSKQIDAQAGLETSMGATLAALSGINSISGPGMMDFESCFSIEKLVIDNEICGMMSRLLRGIQPKEDFPAVALFQELVTERHLLISPHTRKYLRQEISFPGPVIDRTNRSRWKEEGELTMKQQACSEVKRFIEEYVPSTLDEDRKKELTRQMTREAVKYGMDSIPQT